MINNDPDTLMKELSIIAQDFLDKMKKGKEDYPHLASSINNFDAIQFCGCSMLSTKFDNCVKIISHLSINKADRIMIEYLCVNNPKKAKKEMEKISNIIIKQEENDNV